MKNILLAGVLALGVIGLVAAQPWFDAGSGIGPRGMGLKYNESNDTSAKFHDAVLAGDYITAKRLSDEYGYGKGLLSVMTEEQFSRYSQMMNYEKGAMGIRRQLMDELKDKLPSPSQGNGKGKAWANGFERGFGRGMQKGFGMGMKRGRGPEGDATVTAITIEDSED